MNSLFYRSIALIAPLFLGSLMGCSSILGFEKAKDRAADAGVPSGTSGGGGVGGSELAGGAGSSPDGGPTDAGGAGNGGSGGTDPCIDVKCAAPPAASCDGTGALTVYDSIGSCADGACSYASHSVSCNCQSDQCTTNPCLGVTCDTTPDPSCAVDGTLTSYVNGRCVNGACQFDPAPSKCSFGCAFGACKPDPCTTLVCNQPPPDSCLDDGVTLKTHMPMGSCAMGACSYVELDKQCPHGCAGGACNPDPCASVACDAPPSSSCQSSTSALVYDPTGSCDSTNGTCSYHSQLITCTCVNNACTTDPCANVKCNAPPIAACTGPKTATSYASTGTCSGGSCSYAPTNTNCPFGCSNGACNPDPCASVTCNTPPAPSCTDGSTLGSYSSPGTCNSATGSALCSYSAQSTPCKFGCANGACAADPCLGVSCTSPPKPTCASSSKVRTFDASGTCSSSGGATSCSYSYTDTACGTNQLCSAGSCVTCTADSSCGASCTACSGSTPHCQATSGTSKCVQCLSNADCTNQACVNGACSGSCAPGQLRCDPSSNGVQTCSSAGQWGSAVACTNQACVGGVCKGSCVPGTSCGAAASCTNGVATAAGSCDSSGTCQPGKQTTCAPFLCGASACKTSCTSKSDCVSSEFCWLGACVHATAISSGAAHTCALTSGGTVQCWGRNNGDQLGIDSNTVGDPGTPVAVKGLPAGMSQVAAGGDHSCALASDGSVWCWGSCGYGEIGDGCTSGVHPTPAKVLSGATAVAAGLAHTCAALTGGGAMCWGTNNNNALGVTGITSSPTPVAVTALTVPPATIALASSNEHTCYMTSSGASQCWGSNAYGETGSGATVSAVAAGGYFTCIVTQGAADCRGFDNVGQLGNGTTNLSSNPFWSSVVGLSSGVGAIAASFDAACAIDSSQNVRCWGSFDLNGVNQTSPIGVGIANATGVSLGTVFECAITNTGIVCLGRNGDGQLGNGTFADSQTPVQVLEP